MSAHLPTTVYSQEIDERNEDGRFERNINNLLVHSWEEYVNSEDINPEVRADVLILDLDSEDWSKYNTDSKLNQAFTSLGSDMEYFINDGGVIIALYDNEVSFSAKSSGIGVKNIDWLKDIQPLSIMDVRSFRGPDPKLEIKPTVPVVEDYLSKVNKQPNHKLSLRNCEFSEQDEIILASVDDDPAAIAFQEQKVGNEIEEFDGFILLLPRPLSFDIKRLGLIKSLLAIGEEYSEKEASFHIDDFSSLDDAGLSEEDQAYIERAKRHAEDEGCPHEDTEVVVVQKGLGISIPGVGGLQGGDGEINIVCKQCGKHYTSNETIEDEKSGLLN